MFLLLKNNRVIITFFGFTLFLLIYLAYLWGWKTSGVLENTLSLSYPEGYRYNIFSSEYGFWGINKESSYYLLAAQGFLGVEGATLNVGCLYEIYRAFYPLLLRSFWFLEPMNAVLALDIFVWFLACIAIWSTIKNFELGRITGFFAVFLTVFGQGFLQSVGEGMPHVMGYASGYFILFLLSYFKTWKKEKTWLDDLPVYAFFGIWQLTYGTALFFLPLAVFATFYRYYLNSNYKIKEFLLLISLAVIPYLTITFFVKVFFQNSGGVCNIVFENLGKNYTGFSALIKNYMRVLIDSFLSLGPVALVGGAGFFQLMLSKDNIVIKIFIITCMFQFLGMAVLLMPLAGRGYATFNFYSIICLGAAFFLEKLWKSKSHYLKSCSVIFCIFWIFYTHSAKFGFTLPSQIFFTGIENLDRSWWGYELLFFQ